MRLTDSQQACLRATLVGKWSHKPNQSTITILYRQGLIAPRIITWEELDRMESPELDQLPSVVLTEKGRAVAEGLVGQV